MFSYKRVFRPVVPASLPPLRDLKVVNDPLPDEQRRAIGDFLKECLLYKDYLLQEIFRLHSRKETMNIPTQVIKNAIRDTIVESQEILTRILSYKPLISAIRDVPPEIWAHIFLLCMPEPSRSASSACSSPHSLYQVCSTWRLVALSDPRLWCSVHLTITCNSTKWRATLSRMNYARVMPMHVSVASYDPFGATALVDDSSIREFVRTTSHHWRTLHYVAFSRNIEAFIDADMPALESLTIGSFLVILLLILPGSQIFDPSLWSMDVTKN
ncbi:hypothetical protein BDZ89DRAFT_631151 [Hymenopellis radicata]|nr:hypothetical protein BDZ89DRAFT_631151 [Hymenopellis radicata]